MFKNLPTKRVHVDEIHLTKFVDFGKRLIELLRTNDLIAHFTIDRAIFLSFL